jgi:hypothetical protein
LHPMMLHHYSRLSARLGDKKGLDATSSIVRL